MLAESVAMPRLSTFRISQSLLKSKKCKAKLLQERHDSILYVYYQYQVNIIRLNCFVYRKSIARSRSASIKGVLLLFIHFKK